MKASRRLLQELQQCGHMPSYAYNEVNIIHREINYHNEQIKAILQHHKDDLQDYIVAKSALMQPSSSTGFVPDEGVADFEEHRVPDIDGVLVNPVLEFPTFALWIHVSSLQQLTRAIHIYRHERQKWINEIALESFGTGAPVLPELRQRLSIEEVQTLHSLQQVLRQHGATIMEEVSGSSTTYSRAKTLVFEKGGVILPSSHFCNRMAMMALGDTQLAQVKWAFDDPSSKCD